MSLALTIEGLPISVPHPTGSRILIEPLPQKDKTASGIVLTSETIRAVAFMQPVGKVVAMGPDCYLDINKYPTGPYCQPGDYVQFNPYDGISIDVTLEEGDKEQAHYKSIAASAVLATIDVPEAVAIEVI
jgi:co-chaperonin GroES (HSP10)